MCVKQSTANASVLGDCGRFPLCITTVSRVLVYWLKILSLPNDRYVKQCYNMLLIYDRNGMKNWATNIKQLLYTNGFGYVWNNQGVDDKKLFLKIFTDRMRDQYRQN